ncbi:hypothetical protein E1211_17810 [Micromonospora sp. 15K316]|uniref:hypothetical protein n=1 Tax=Micromonospora sp. 15K316 TaxID=2530376 RepID=UPI0010428EB7|nr:hypothetical protein [Micromonospora sp. 15K316]TDC34204.1 hypothetical protein E1211_17810 [Micromonospora sp. 15K316]
MKSNRLAGHTLPNEGRLYDRGIYLVREGAIRCSCGDVSPFLPNATARRRWHREHKAAVRAAADPR